MQDVATGHSPSCPGRVRERRQPVFRIDVRVHLVVIKVAVIEHPLPVDVVVIQAGATALVGLLPPRRRAIFATQHLHQPHD